MNKRNPTFLRKHEQGIPLLGRRFPFSLTPPFQKTPSTSSASFTRHNPLPSSPQLHPNPQKNAILKKKKKVKTKGKLHFYPNTVVPNLHNHQRRDRMLLATCQGKRKKVEIKKKRKGKGDKKKCGSHRLSRAKIRTKPGGLDAAYTVKTFFPNSIR